MKENKLKQVIHSIGEIPTLPSVVARVMQVLSDPYSSASDLTEIISVDQAMTFRILKMANSAYYGFPRAVATVTEAIVLLGFTTVRNLILTTMMYNFDQMWTPRASQPKPVGSQALFNQRQAWKHAVATAIMTRELLTSQRMSAQENFGFLAGLMHDVGKVLFYHYFLADYAMVLRQESGDQRSLLQREVEVMGAHHGQVGAWMVDRWNLPAEIVTPIACHHAPEEAKEQKALTQVLYMANRLAHATLQDETEAEGLRRPSQPGTMQIWEQLGLSTEQIQNMEKSLLRELQEIEKFMQV
ncbi:MAG: HDOD domain-containing protein [candidate division FCPU426 bacterium]